MSDQPKPKIYFAHSPSDFDTEFEKQVVEHLEEQGYEVFNPNCPEGAAAYRDRKIGFGWFNERAKECDACAYLALPNRMVGSGVAVNVDTFFKRNAPVFRVFQAEGGRIAMRQVTAPLTEHIPNGMDTSAMTQRFKAMANGGRA